jgi:hypothetical protein
MSDPIPMGRARPDGYLLRWSCAIPNVSQGVIPFLIEDDTPREERLPRQREHSNGVTGIARLTIALPELAVYAPALAAALGEGAPIVREEMHAHGLRYTLGATLVDALTPQAGEGPLAAWIAQRGAALYSVDFRTRGSRLGALPLADTLNTHITLVPEA